MTRALAALALVTGITSCLLARPARAEEPWYSVYRSDHRDWTLSLSGGIALLDLEGDGSFDADFLDTDFSFDGTLGVSDIDTPWSEVDLQLLGGQHLRFAYVPMGFDGSEALDTDIVVDGVTYDAGDLVDTDLQLDQYELSFRSEFWVGEFLSIAPLVQISLIDAKLKLANQTQGLTEVEDVLVPLPYLGLRAELYPLARLGIFAEGKGMGLGSTATIWDAIGGISLHLTRNVSLTGRYRLSHYEVEFDSEIDVDIAGPQLGATVRF
jgi:hypothetical protein